jgi:hypothetical protein
MRNLHGREGSAPQQLDLALYSLEHCRGWKLG